MCFLCTVIGQRVWLPPVSCPWKELPFIRITPGNQSLTAAVVTAAAAQRKHDVKWKVQNIQESRRRRCDDKLKTEKEMGVRHDLVWCKAVHCIKKTTTFYFIAYRHKTCTFQNKALHNILDPTSTSMNYGSKHFSVTEYKAQYFIGLPILAVNWLEPPSVLHKVEYVLHRFHGLFNNWGLRPHLNVGNHSFEPSECCNKVRPTALKTLKSWRGRKYSPYNLCIISRSVGGKWNDALKKRGDILNPFLLDRPAVVFFLLSRFMPLPGWTVFHKFSGSFPSFQQNPRHGNQAISYKGTVTDSNSHSEKSEKGRPGIKGSLGMELRRNTVVNSQASLLDVSYSEAAFSATWRFQTERRIPLMNPSG